MPTLPEFHTH